ncbi:hypothetical protein KYK29_11925 [Shinella daejeonensis]|uniref:hypothetical protein n=1 Tax=Shinella daejeonensis TaxID=659017 RepID=UPI0020C76A52|nr:hypothetical protein [Shinella daejeonensis]MCP8895629.1 hypothetical protein [Shinella daejeonensis]
MTTADKACHIGFTNIIDDRKKTKIAVTKVVATPAPKSGEVAVTGKDLIYTPAKGFKGRDTVCTRNSAPKVPRATLSGCITVTVR